MRKPDTPLPQCSQCVYRKNIGWYDDSYCTLHKKITAATDECEHFSNTAKRGEFKRLRKLIIKETQ
jgi:hypothetical protein